METLNALIIEKKNLGSSFVHCHALLQQEINRLQLKESESNGACGSESQEPISGSSPSSSAARDNPFKAKVLRKPGDYVSEQVIKLSEKVFVPVKEYPRFNFVGKILGPRGNTLKRLQGQTRTKMSVLGRGSMRSKEQEEELRNNDDPKYSHLNEPLHVLIEVECGQSDAHMRLATAISEVKKYLTPENDEIRQDQMREMAYIQSMQEPGAPLPPVAPSPRGRGRPLMRGAPLRSGLPPVVRGRPGPVPRHGLARHSAAPDPYGYDIYEAGYDAPFADAGENVYYEYEAAEDYEYGATTSQAVYPTSSYKSPSVRPVKRVIREATYPY